MELNNLLTEIIYLLSDTSLQIVDALSGSSNMVKLSEPFFQPSGDSQYVTGMILFGDWISPVEYWGSK